MAFFVFLGNYIFISDQNVITQSNRNRTCIFSSSSESRRCIFSVATNLENMENLEVSGNLKNCRNLKETQGHLIFFVEKTWKTQGKCKICYLNVNKNVFQHTFLSQFTQKKFENTLEMSGKIQGI